MELRSLLLLVAGAPAVLGFQAAMRVGAMKPAMAVDPAMLDAAAIVDAPMQLLALKSEADEVIDELFGLVYPVGTAIGLGLIVKGLVDDQLKSSRLSQLIFLAVGGFFTFIFLALALP